MKTGELKSALEDLGAVLTEAGAKAAAQDVDSLVKLLESHEHKSVDEFLEELCQSLRGPGKKGAGVAPAADEAVVVDHVDKLKGAGLDRAAFEAQLKALKADKRVGKPELDRIAHDFIGGRDTWPSRKAALDAIQTRFNERAYQASKMKHLEKFRPW